jgi:hypothetical protein
MTKLLCSALAAGSLAWAAMPAAAAEGCEAVPELRAAAERAEVEEVTEGKIDSLLNDVEGMCEEGWTEDLEVKLRNIRELLESDIESLPDPQQEVEIDPQRQG